MLTPGRTQERTDKGALAQFATVTRRLLGVVAIVLA